MHKHGHITPLDDTFCTQRLWEWQSDAKVVSEVAGRLRV
jgi:hypothetical protein